MELKEEPWCVWMALEEEKDEGSWTNGADWEKRGLPCFCRYLLHPAAFQRWDFGGFLFLDICHPLCPGLAAARSWHSLGWGCYTWNEPPRHFLRSAPENSTSCPKTTGSCTKPTLRCICSSAAPWLGNTEFMVNSVLHGKFKSFWFFHGTCRIPRIFLSLHTWLLTCLISVFPN